MNDMLNSGLKWLAEMLNKYSSRLVTYRRGNATTTLNATIGRTLLKLSDDYGSVRMQWTDRDFLVKAADLKLNGELTLPQRGDQIVEVDNGVTRTYEVLTPGNEPEWRWADPHHVMLRIHTKLLAEER